MTGNKFSQVDEGEIQISNSFKICISNFVFERIRNLYSPLVNLGKFIPGHLSDDDVVQKRYWYGIAAESSKPFSTGQMTIITPYLILKLAVHLKLDDNDDWSICIYIVRFFFFVFIFFLPDETYEHGRNAWR